MTSHGNTRWMLARPEWIAVVLCVATYHAAGADLQSGVDAYTTGNFAEAVSHFRPLAEAGDPQAQFNMGVLAFKGHGVPMDPVESYAWLTASGRQGFVFACRYRKRVQAELSPEQLIAALAMADAHLAGLSTGPQAPEGGNEDWCPEEDSNPRPTP